MLKALLSMVGTGTDLKLITMIQLTLLDTVLNPLKGAKFVHSGDSGPCDSLYSAISKTDLAIIEMAIPEWVPSSEHHKPSDIQKLSERLPSVHFIITHTFIDSKIQQCQK